MDSVFCSAGSSVLLATDGLANKGVGALEELADETSAALFYQEVGEQGRLHGVTVRKCEFVWFVLNMV